MDVRHEEQLVRSLLAPLAALEPVTLRARSSRRKTYAALAALVLAIVVTGIALGGSLNPLSGIGAADHPPTPKDVLNPDVQAQLRADLASPGSIDPIGGRLTGAARFIGTLPSGKPVYLIPTAKGRLCVLVAGLAESCGDPLTMRQPITFTTVFRHPGDPTYAYGVARDGVTAVSFTVSPGRPVTVPVQRNFFVYESDRSSSPRGFADVRVTFSDGRVESIG